MKDSHRMFLVMGVVQIVAYGILCVNYRAVAHTDYAVAAVSDFAFASLNFFVIRRIAKAEDSVPGWAGYATGSVIGSLLGIWLSAEFLT